MSNPLFDTPIKRYGAVATFLSCSFLFMEGVLSAWEAVDLREYIHMNIYRLMGRIRNSKEDFDKASDACGTEKIDFNPVGFNFSPENDGTPGVMIGLARDQFEALTKKVNAADKLSGHVEKLRALQQKVEKAKKSTKPNQLKTECANLKLDLQQQKHDIQTKTSEIKLAENKLESAKNQNTQMQQTIELLTELLNEKKSVIVSNKELRKEIELLTKSLNDQESHSDELKKIQRTIGILTKAQKIPPTVCPATTTALEAPSALDSPSETEANVLNAIEASSKIESKALASVNAVSKTEANVLNAIEASSKTASKALASVNAASKTETEVSSFIGAASKTETEVSSFIGAASKIESEVSSFIDTSKTITSTAIPTLNFVTTSTNTKQTNLHKTGTLDEYNMLRLPNGTTLNCAQVDCKPHLSSSQPINSGHKAAEISYAPIYMLAAAALTAITAVSILVQCVKKAYHTSTKTQNHNGKQYSLNAVPAKNEARRDLDNNQVSGTLAATKAQALQHNSNQR